MRPGGRAAVTGTALWPGMQCECLRDGRIAQPRLGAALIGHVQRQRDGAVRRLEQRNGDFEFLVVDHLFTEVFVLLDLTFWELNGSDLAGIVCDLDSITI